MKTEKAIFAETIAELQNKNLAGFDRVYFGHETCERRLPSKKEFACAKKICEKNSLDFSLVAPFCTNKGIENLKPLLKGLSKDDELIVNDFGVLLLAQKSCNAGFVAGRILNRQYRDPRISVFKNPPNGMLEHLRSSQAANPLFQSLLKKFNVQRVELDNLLQGIDSDFSNSGFRVSLYHPFVFVSATRFCLSANCDKLSFAKKIGIFPCGKNCLNYSFRLDSKEFNKPLFIFGNAIYFKNEKIPENLPGLGIDRLVFTGKMPLLSEL